tara:strand:- start:56 stop:241 length:186 start_codon:yes stop_codon:yes gene_type:complete
MDEMNITAAQYVDPYGDGEHSGIQATIDGQELFVPIAEGNRHYDEIKRQVDAGTLNIEAAD